MKKTFIIIGIIFLIIIGSLIAIPVLFKDALLEKTKTTLKNKLGVEVEFSGFNLSLFRDFPKASLELKNVLVSGTNPFQNDTLLFIPEFSSAMSLSSLFNKDGATIEKLEMKSPLLKLLVDRDGLANWDFAQGSAPEATNENMPESTQEKAFQLGLEGVVITGANILYLDNSSGVTLTFNNTDLNLSGKMYGSTTDLNVWSKVGDFVLMYDSLAYISNTTLETNTILNVDYEKMRFGIKENELLVNRLPLVVNGEVSVPNDTIQFNLDINSAKSGLEEFLALVPPEYESYLDGLTAQGNATMSGSVRGYYYEEQYPALNFAFKIGEGNLKYDGLPEDIRNITADVSLNKAQGNLSLMEVKIKQAHTEVKNNPVDLTLSITNLFGDPYFDGGLVGKINFDHLKDALPLDSVNMAGEIDANVFIKASYSAIMNEQYDKIKSDGIVYLSGFTYADPKLNRPIHVPNGQLNFSPSFVELSEMDVRIGQSDMRLAGKVSNYLGYFLGDGLLKGTLSLNSQLVNLNELMNLQVENKVKSEEPATAEEAQQEDTGEKLTAFDIPENIDLQFTSNISNVIFGNLPITNVDGLITARNGKLVLQGLKCRMFEGLVTLTGSYENNKENMPAFDFGFDISEVDLPAASRTVSSLHELMPPGSKSQGKISARFNANGRLSPGLKIIPASVDGSGLFNTNNIQIIDSPTFAQLKNLLKQEKLKNITVDNFTANFNVTDGNLQLRPFKTKIAGQQTTIEGSLNVEDILNLKMDFVVERSAFGPDIQELLGALPGQEKITAVPVTVMLTGPVNNPEVKMDYTDTRKYITEKVKESASDGLKRIGNALKKLIDQ